MEEGQIAPKIAQTSDKKRTGTQNKALHLYCQLVADRLNESGLNIEKVLRNFTMEVDWTKESIKEILWKTAQRRMFGKESTTELDKHQEITKIWEVMNRFLAKLKVESIPFPSFGAIQRLEEYQNEKKD